MTPDLKDILENIFPFGLEKTEVSFDILTSIVIIVSAVTFLVRSYSQSKKDKEEAIKEREAGINENTRSVALGRIQAILSEFEDDFFELFKKSVEVTSPIAHEMEQGGLKGLAEKIKVEANYVENLQTKSEAFHKEVHGYYYGIQKRRYSLYPVIDSLPDSQGALNDIEKDIEDIRKAANIGHDWHNLVSELVALKEAARTFFPENKLPDFTEDPDIDISIASKILDDEDITKFAIRIFLNPKYWHFSKGFVAPEKGEMMENAIKRGGVLNEDEKEVFNNFMFRALVAGLMQGNIDLYIAQVCVYNFNDMKKARQECRDILVKLSALTHKIMKNDEKVRYTDVIKTYEEDYFTHDSAY